MANTKQPVDWGGLSESKIQQIKEANAKSRAQRQKAEDQFRATYNQNKNLYDSSTSRNKFYNGRYQEVSGAQQQLIDKFRKEADPKYKDVYSDRIQDNPNFKANLAKAREKATVQKMASGGIAKSKGKASTASRRADGIAQRGKTKGHMV